jgi:pimeloyl-ACP methyl ester carboxylesterase
MNTAQQVGIFALFVLFECAGQSFLLPQALRTNAQGYQVADGARDRASHDTWADKSLHKSAMIQANGIMLHYLDWGVRGEALLFLAGLGNNAHIFDDLAPKFTSRFRVLAMTRRGFGLSDKPESGYDIDSRVADDLAVLDALQIKRVILVGHSIAGDELTEFAARHPDRVDKLIYLDAAIDRSHRPEAEVIRRGNDPVGGPSIPKEVLASVDAYLDHFRRMFPDVWSDAFEANLRDGITIRADGTVERRTPDRVYRAIRKSSFLATLDYASIKPPTLSFYSDPSTLEDSKARKELAEDEARDIALIRRSGPQIQIAQIPGAGHYLFIDHLEQVVKIMQTFLANAARSR